MRKKRTIRFSGTPERTKGETVVQFDAARSDARAEHQPAPEPANPSGENEKLQRAFDVLSKSLAETEARAADAEKQAEQAEARNAAYAARVSAAEAAADKARVAFEAELSQLRNQLDAAASDVDEVHKQALEATATAHTRETAELQSTHARVLEKQVATTRKELERAFKVRLADALGEAKEQAKTALATDREDWQAEEAERLAAANKEFDVELSQLRQQLDDASLNFDEMRKQALDAAATAHAGEIAELQNAHARALEAQAAATKEELEREFADRMVAANKEFDVELSQLRQQLDDASLDIDDVRKQALDAAADDHAREIAELQSTHTQALEAQAAATNEELEQAFADRLADTLRQAEEKAETHLKKTQQEWAAEAEAGLATARKDWQTEEAERLAAANKEFDVELSQLRQQLDDASLDIDDVRKQALDAAATDHAREIAELQSAHARALDEQIAAVTEKLEQEFAGRLADTDKQREDTPADDRMAEALREAEQAAAARLEAARQEWAAEAEASLAAAQETWKVEEAERLAAAFKLWQGHPPEEKKTWRLPRLPHIPVRLWVPRRPLVIKLGIVGLLALALLHPEVKSRIPGVKDLAAERSEVAAADLRVYFDPLISKLTGSEPLAPPPSPQSTEEPVDSVKRTTIGVARANIRTGPSTGARVINTLDRGSELIVLESQEGWLHVRYGAAVDEVGWVHSDLLGAAP